MRDLAQEGFRDAAELTNTWQPTWPANRRGPGIARFLPPLARIDQVLVGPDLAALSSNSVRIENTDHLAVVAELAWAASPARRSRASGWQDTGDVGAAFDLSVEPLRRGGGPDHSCARPNAGDREQLLAGLARQSDS
jgi:hypothetical protein